jgi:predicted site-specific integrase-resolvase
MLVSIGKVAKLIGVSISTLRRWEQEDYLHPESRTAGGHRRYKLSQIKEIFLGEIPSNKINLAYSRVSSSDQKGDLQRQADLLEGRLKSENLPYKVIKDLGSGLKTDKPGLKKLLSLVLAGKVNKLFLTHSDRLLRFGSNIIFQICKVMGTSVEVLFQKEDKSFEIELAEDVIAIMTSSCARLYGRRAHQKLKATA